MDITNLKFLGAKVVVKPKDTSPTRRGNKQADFEFIQLLRVLEKLSNDDMIEIPCEDKNETKRKYQSILSRSKKFKKPIRVCIRGFSVRVWVEENDSKD